VKERLMLRLLSPFGPGTSVRLHRTAHQLACKAWTAAGRRARYEKQARARPPANPLDGDQSGRLVSGPQRKVDLTLALLVRNCGRGLAAPHIIAEITLTFSIDRALHNR
jgi:hypothetical protein